MDDLKKKFYQQQVAMKQLQELVVKDSLTGLYNQKGFMEEVKRAYKEIAYQKKHPEQVREHFFVDELSILFIDIDNFKSINDTYGHSVGSQILKRVSSIVMNDWRNVPSNRGESPACLNIAGRSGRFNNDTEEKVDVLALIERDCPFHCVSRIGCWNPVKPSSSVTFGYV